jgi:hypothetical protein
MSGKLKKYTTVLTPRSARPPIKKGRCKQVVQKAPLGSVRHPRVVVVEKCRPESTARVAVPHEGQRVIASHRLPLDMTGNPTDYGRERHGRDAGHLFGDSDSNWDNLNASEPSERQIIINSIYSTDPSASSSTTQRPSHSALQPYFFIPHASRILSAYQPCRDHAPLT